MFEKSGGRGNEIDAKLVPLAPSIALTRHRSVTLHINTFL